MNPILRRVVDHRTDASWAAKFRRQRFGFLMSRLEDQPKPVSILDLGGEQDFWERMGLAGNAEFQITVLNTTQPVTTEANLHGIAGDARDLSQFASQSFDLVFSNSVIEHLGSLLSQQRMAGEVQRVGKSYFVQTPNRRFPLEPHFLLPWFQFFPLAIQVALVRRFNLGWYRRLPDPNQARELVESHRLLSETELKVLFPDGEVYREKIFGLTKSFSIYRFTDG